MIFFVVVLSKFPIILALACSLLTKVLNIAMNNICFLNYFLAIFTETWEVMTTIFKRADSGKRSCYK